MNWPLAAVVLLGCGALWVFFKVQKKGFGPYNTSVFLLLAVVIFASVLATVGAVEPNDIAAIMLAVVGFAGGLFAGKKMTKKTQTQNTKLD